MERANKTILLLVAALAITLCAAGCGGGGGGGGSTGTGGTNPSGFATVTGTLLDSVTHQPLTGVVVSVSVASNLTATTNSSGGFSIANVPVGAQTLGFTLNSSSIGSQQINVVAPTSALGNIDISTEGSPPPAPPI